VLTETFDIRWFLSILDGDLNGFCRKAILACPCMSKPRASQPSRQKKFTLLINLDFLRLQSKESPRAIDRGQQADRQFVPGRQD
jgi:hypothetical protein